MNFEKLLEDRKIQRFIHEQKPDFEKAEEDINKTEEFVQKIRTFVQKIRTKKI